MNPITKSMNFYSCYHTVRKKRRAHDEIPSRLHSYGRSIMKAKLICILLLASCMLVSARGIAQKINIQAKGATLAYLLERITDQSGYTLFYEVQDMKTAKKLTVNLVNADIETALRVIFKDQPFGYRIVNKTIAVFEKEKAEVKEKGQPPVAPAQEKITVKGTVTDKDGKPLPGVTVRIKDTNAGTVTDEQGRYSIEADGGGIITFSFIGHQTMTMRIGNKSTLNMTMLGNDNIIQETVVKGYYSTSKLLNTGNVSTVKSDVIERQPVSDPMAALIARVPGLFVQQTSGVPGRQFNVLIRGRNSLDNGLAPLYIVDNIQFDSSPQNSLPVSFPAGGASSPLNYLNPADIESITVLKDADATAIYGSRGANGVILITTKRGKAEKTQVDVNVYSGFSNIERRVKHMNTEEYLAMRREAFKNDGAVPGTTDHDLNGTWDTTRYTDWQDLIIGGTAPLTEAIVGLSGGNDLTQFRISGTYRTEGTVYPEAFRSSKIGTNFNINHRSVNQRLFANFSGVYTNTKNHLPHFGFVQGIDRYILLAPNAPAIYNPDGTFNFAKSTFANPLAPFQASSDEKGTTTIGNLTIEYKILKNLIFKSNFSYNQSDFDQRNIVPLRAQDPDLFPYNTHQILNAKRSSWNVEPQLTYSNTFGKLDFDALIGGTLQSARSSSVGMEGLGYSNDEILLNFTATSIIRPLIASTLRYKYSALYSRVGLNYDNRYVLNVTARRDGSSRFGPGRKFGNFGAVGAAWIVTNEKFMDEVEWLSLIKLRGSIGATGNDQLGDYKYLDTYSPITGAYQGVNALVPTQLTNPFYSWERVDKTEYGLELGFLNDRILLTSSFYKNRTKNQLVQYALPSVTGFDRVRQNLPAVIQNTGLEFELSTSNIERKDFSWSTTANITFPRNKLVSYPNIEASSYARRFQVGKPLALFWGYNYLGIDPNTSLYLFEDRNNDGRLSAASDHMASFVGQKYYGGITNNFKLNNFQLDFTFQYTRQNGRAYYFNGAPGFFNGGQGNQVLLKNENINLIPYSQSKFENSISVSNFVQSTGSIADASFLRLKNISFVWSIPIGEKLRKTLNRFDVYLQGQNLFTVSSYQGFDPENPSTGPLVPSLRTYSAGIRLSL